VTGGASVASSGFVEGGGGRADVSRSRLSLWRIRSLVKEATGVIRASATSSFVDAFASTFEDIWIKGAFGDALAPNEGAGGPAGNAKLGECIAPVPGEIIGESIGPVPGQIIGLLKCAYSPARADRAVRPRC
jgi:hypothetical protein